MRLYYTVLSNPEFLVALRRGASKRLMSDASVYGMGGALLQQEDDGKWHPVSSTSWKLTDAERKFTVTKKECLTVVDGLRKWRFYQHGETEVIVVTDHRSLRWLMSLKDPRGRLERWMVSIQDFDFTVVDAPRGELVVPDTLSRDSVEKPLLRPRCFKRMEEPVVVEGKIEAFRAVVELSGLGGGPSTHDFREAQCEEFGDVLEHVNKRRSSGYTKNERGLLRRTRANRELFVVPKRLVNAVLDEVHGSKLSGHYRVRRTTYRHSRPFWWPGWRKDMADRLRCCVACTATKAHRPAKNAKMMVYHPGGGFNRSQSTFSRSHRGPHLEILRFW